MNPMSSKERVISAVNLLETDRLPLGYISTTEVDDRLKNHFKTDSMDTVLEALNVDIRVINAEYKGPELRTWPDGRFENFWGQIKKPIQNEAGTYFESVEFPYAEFQTLEDVEKFKWPKIEWFDFSGIEASIEKYKDYAIVFGYPGLMDLINGTSGGRGVEKVMFDIALEDPIGFACMDKRFECCYKLAEKALQTARGKIDIVWIGDDYGSQNGLLMNPNTWKKLFYPKLRKFCSLVHDYGAKVMLHSCGSTRRILPEIIDAGVDIYDTVQPEAKDMDFESLYGEFGDRIAMHGSISTQKTLPFGTVEDVRKEVQSRIDVVAKHGGLIIAPAHNFQPDTPVENIIALYEQACL